MNHSTFHIQKAFPQKAHRHNTKRLTEDQVRLLESSFDSNKKLEPERKQRLSCQLGIPPRQIAIWYQNKRARWKNQRLEYDYNMLQLQLEATLAEARQLQKEVERLRAELDKVQAEQARHNKYYANNNNNYHKEDVNNFYCFGEQVFQVEELYATARMMCADLGPFGSETNLS